uniref:preprotein translocase subunit G n=1 Tax=Pulvinaster venetus TaxID=427767 RepID=UPI001FCD2D11|nr:preprotein translocase subunit G [Pulvinaster venetus]UNJ17022.1 preprotein translocase subunit G [Pulvinaster venetus]
MKEFLKSIWYIISLCLIIIIIIQNPKAEGSNRIYSTNFFNTNKDRKKTLTITTWILIISFLLLTSILAIVNFKS